MADLQLETSVTRSGRRAHNDMAVAIGLNATLEPGQFPVRQKFGPAAQVKSRLRLVGRKLDRQRSHGLSLPLCVAARQLAGTALGWTQDKILRSLCFLGVEARPAPTL